MNDLKRSRTSVGVARKPSILAKTFLKSCKNYPLSGDLISRPLALRHTAHVGASGHNFGDLSFLEPGGRCRKSNGLECDQEYDSPVLRKTESIPSVARDACNSLAHAGSGLISDSGHGSDAGTFDKISSQFSSATEDDLSSLSDKSDSSPETDKVEIFCDFTIDLGPDLLEDVMGMIAQMHPGREGEKTARSANKKTKPIKV
ncbi:Oidioi.mRNA.OKI2018_I69.XSR.g14012.t1.cds [Oikopleura dioica]|uniref:Oidioi.mRNA.OKI2018_I69.XSR.g14012.t1.cds n=1 Tax=Oikopleura dioica TaxID=34765 RepID=A0ABN7SDF1_OIKDI|nr:Oidioi.mRNA.OKI2018_I69.XSR.g14012.t1.cds [Oikopleura dioica]